MTGSTSNQHINIVGAGLAGALLATRLGQAGISVSVYESRSDPRGKSIGGGRSINLAISARGLHALGQVGLADEILSLSIPMAGRMMHSVNGQLKYQAYSAHREDVINSVSRSDLNMKLIEAADALPNVEFCFDHKCVGVNTEAGCAEFHNGDNGPTKRSPEGLVIGCDGAFSAVRKTMQRSDRFDFSQTYLEHGYKELCIPPKPGGTHALEPNALHIWPRQSFMMIALPNQDGSFTCTLFLAFESESGPCFARLDNEDRMRSFFNTHFRDAMDLMPTLADDFFSNPTGSLVTIRCAPWHLEGKVALVGDAAHAVVPFYGQGANAAFGDCTVLGDLLVERGQSDLGWVVREYFHRRKVHTDALADLAIQNFVEMRDHTGSQLFLWKKKLEQTLHKVFPKSFLPLYSMVSFTCVPYQSAVDRANRQWQIVRWFAMGIAAITTLLLIWLIARS